MDTRIGEPEPERTRGGKCLYQDAKCHGGRVRRPVLGFPGLGKLRPCGAPQGIHLTLLYSVTHGMVGRACAGNILGDIVRVAGR